MVIAWLDKTMDKIADKIDPPVRTILKPEYRDQDKARSRRGPNGSALSRRERARNMETAQIKEKLDGASRKAGHNIGGLGRAGGTALATTKALHLHLAASAVVEGGANAIGTFKQGRRYNDYEKEYIARGEQHDRDARKFLGDVWDGAKGKGKMDRKVRTLAKAADGLEGVYEANQSEPTYCKFEVKENMGRLLLMCSRSAALYLS